MNILNPLFIMLIKTNFAFLQPCSMGFATGGKTFFLWGGCMMMHADDFRDDRYCVFSGLRDGGYSDDMTLAALAGILLIKCCINSLVFLYFLEETS